MKERTRALLREKLFGVEAQPIKVGRFVIVDTVGSGAMGTVYAAYDPDLDRKVAVKLIRSDLAANEVSRQRLIREARAMARLSHPNVISVHDVGTVDGTVFFAMELVEGGSLRTWLSASERSWRDIVDVFIQAGRGLQAAHAVGLIHRDFKPDNVLVRTSGRAQVLDFGVAWVVDSPEDQLELEDSGISEISGERGASLTRTGGLVGTPRYMAPEQHSAAPTDPRTDQFSFCVALWEALYGEPPFAGNNMIELAEQVLAGRLVEPKTERGVPGRFRKILERGLQVDPKQRYDSMAALLADLGHDPSKRRRTAAVIALCAAAIGVGAFGLIQARSASKSAAEACTDGADKLAAWTPGRTAELRRVFSATKAPAGELIAARAGVELDKYGKAWRRMHKNTCEAGRRKEHSDAMLDRRMACLHDRRVHYEALSQLLMKADRGAVLKAVHAVHGLPSIERCADLQALSKLVPPPEDAATADRVAKLQARLAGVRAQMTSGRYKAGLAAAKQLVADGAGLNYEPWQAEALVLQGRLENKTGDYEDAKKHLEKAYFMALRAKHDEAAGEAAVALALIIGVRQGKHAEGLSWVKHAESVVKRFKPDGVLAAFLAESKGDLLHRYGKLADAEASYRDAIKLRKATDGRASLGLAAALNGLAQLLERRGRFDEALKHHKRALALTSAELGEHHPNTIITLNGLATSLAKRGDFKRAVPLMEQSLEGMEIAFGKHHTNVGHVVNNLGIMHYRLGRYERALTMMRRSLAIKEKAVGKDHPSISGVLNNMGLVLQPMGRLEEALAVYLRSAALDKKHLKPDNPKVADNKNNLAGVYRALGKLDLARRHHEEALAVLRKVHGPGHPSVAHSLNGLGSVYLRKRDYANARKHYEQALAIWTKAYGPGKSILAHPHANLGNVYSSLRKYDQAKAHYEKAEALWRKNLGPMHQYTTDMLTSLGNLHRKWGKREQALDYYAKAIAAKTKTMGAEHPDVANVLLGQGDTYVDLKRYAKAIGVLRKAVAIRSKRAGDPARVGEAQFSLAIALWSSGQKATAIALAKRARDNYKKGQQTAPAIDRWLAKRATP